ncbi:MAG TPA: DUF4340 domain-containing protein [Rhizomicrobium sp.]|nr:DUF4340 domain-containing protein [Rhizomicrobium sp.]
MQAGSIFKDRRRRNLAGLIAGAVVIAALAALALARQAELLAPKTVAQTFFPDLPSKVREIARIRIVSKTHSFDVVFRPERGWVLPDKGNYHADFDQVRQTIIGMAALQTIEPKTARPGWLHYVDLDAPPKGDGVEIILQDESGKTLAALIAGKTEDIGDESAQGLYVRRPDENQSWLVRSVFVPQSDPAQWMDKEVVDVDSARIQETDVDPADGPSYEVVRDKPSDADFTLSPVPKGREVAFAAGPDGVAQVLSGFSFDDAAPERDFDFTDATRIVTRTFDGLVVAVRIIKQGADYWATVSADSVPGRDAAADEARKIDGKASGWAYRLPAYKGQQFMTSLESLLKPKDAPAK